MNVKEWKTSDLIRLQSEIEEEINERNKLDLKPGQIVEWTNCFGQKRRGFISKDNSGNGYVYAITFNGTAFVEEFITINERFKPTDSFIDLGELVTE